MSNGNRGNPLLWMLAGVGALALILILGGLLTSTLLNLFVMPTLYLHLARRPLSIRIPRRAVSSD